ncbi:SRPBCC family protein [Streptomyces thinghirensis]|nr:SRPBCC family protein [Streptomyces thinghirensis]
MARKFTVSGSIVIDVPPDAAYLAVSRPGDMGRWSPENLGTTTGSADGSAALGASFVRAQQARRVRSGSRGCTVTAAEPGQRFAFRVHAIGLSRPRLPGPIATWEYRFEPVGDGTRVTETWTDDRRTWPAFAANAFDRLVTSGKTFAEFQVRNIETTLRNLKRELEQARTP